MKQTMPEKLRLIADCIEQGKTVQFYGGFEGWTDCEYVPASDGTISIHASTEYRAKPDKPRTGTWNGGRCRCYGYEAIELTEEVKKALQDADIDYG